MPPRDEDLKMRMPAIGDEAGGGGTKQQELKWRRMRNDIVNATRLMDSDSESDSDADSERDFS